MPPTPSPDLLALLAAVRAAPDDDTPRLVLADFLEESGRGAWAALVRAQCELSRARESGSLTPTEQVPLRERVAALIEARALDMVPGVEELDPFAYSWSGEAEEPEVAVYEGEQPDPALRVRLRRGFVSEVVGGVADLRDRLPALLRYHPVERAVPTDREAVGVVAAGGGFFADQAGFLVVPPDGRPPEVWAWIAWDPPADGDHRAILPAETFTHLEGGRVIGDDDREERVMIFDSPAAAADAVSRALIAEAEADAEPAGARA